MKAIFILGSGHCGTTLLDLLLSAHSQVVGTGEMERLCQEENIHPFWKEMIKKHNIEHFHIHRSKRDFILNKDRYFYLEDKEKVSVAEYINLNQRLMSELLERVGANMIVGSSKTPSRAELLIRYGNIEPVIVHLVRDGRGVVWSYIKKYGPSFFHAWRWFASNVKISIGRMRNNVPSIRVLYKDLAQDPEKELKRICRVAGVAYTPKMLHFRQAEQYQIGGNRMKKSTSEEIKEDVEWKDKLPLKDRVVFNLLFGWLHWIYKVT